MVVGGGQAGLSVGYHLARRGFPFVILDAHERIGDAWRQRWDSLRLFTPARFSALAGMPFPGDPNAFPTKDQMADYLAGYAARFGLPVRELTGGGRPGEPEPGRTRFGFGTTRGAPGFPAPRGLTYAVGAGRGRGRGGGVSWCRPPPGSH